MLDANEMARLVRDQDGDGEVTPSTVHYYTQLGLLPPAVGRGKGAFTPEHLARFRLARRLRRQGLSLAEIRDQMARVGQRDLAGMVLEPPPVPAPSARRIIAAAAQAAATPPERSPDPGTALAASALREKAEAPRTLRFRGGFALQLPAGVPDEMVARIYASVEKVLDREVPASGRGRRGGAR
jgi:DNA-binding transcriptional MerR regulator